MDQPGLSLFQGGGSIHVDERAAEEEAEELMDKKRREKELGQQLQNAFDDLLGDEDDDTMDNSYRSGTSFQSQIVNNERLKRNYLDQEENVNCGTDNAIYRLRIELQSKTNELMHVNKVSSHKWIAV